MTDWQHDLWSEIVALEGVPPPAGGSVLVVGQGLPADFDDGVRVVRRDWGEKLGEEAGFDRIFMLAHGHVHADFHLALTQLWKLLRADGGLVVVAARPAPFGVRGSVWHHGLPRWVWARLLRHSGWLVAGRVTVGFSTRLWRWLWPFCGVVQVILAQKRVGGTKVLVRNARGGVELKAAGVGLSYRHPGSN